MPLTRKRAAGPPRSNIQYTSAKTMTFVSQIAAPASNSVLGVRIPSNSMRSRTSRIAATPLAMLMITIVKSVSARSFRDWRSMRPRCPMTSTRSSKAATVGKIHLW